MLVHNGGTTDIKFLITDYLGSITHVMNSGGTIDEERDYDAWGRFRNPVTGTYTGVPTYNYDRGYTSQELLKDFNVINLNGRLYDPLIGRMFSVDPCIVDPSNSQAYNSYSYALNNPLKYTDKDGNEPITATVLLVAGVVGGTINAFNNADKITDLSSLGTYFGVGALAGMASLAGPWAGFAVAATGNVAADKATGKMPNMDKPTDVAMYVGETLLNASGVSGSGQIARAGLSMAVHSGWKQGVTGGITETVYVPGIGYTFAENPVLTSTRTYTKTLIQTGASTVTTKAGKYAVYQGVDNTGVVRYVGMTGRDAVIRFGEHLKSFGTGKDLLKYDIVDGAKGLTKDQARVWEQKLINQYGLEKNGQLLNKINSISPSKWGVYGIK